MNDEPLFPGAALDSQAQGLAEYDSQHELSHSMLLYSLIGRTKRQAR